LATCALVLDFGFECDVPNLNFRRSSPVGHEAADKSPVSLGDEFNTFAIELERITNVSGKAEWLPQHLPQEVVEFL